MKYIISSLLISTLFLSSCGKSEDEGLKMEILNTEILSRGNIKSTHVRNVVRFDNYIYDSLHVNKINIKITNTGTKKYVFFIRKELDNVSIRDENIKPIVLKNNAIIEPSYLGYEASLTNLGFEVRKLRNEIDSDSLKQELTEKYLKEKTDIKKFKFQREINYVVIHPGETKLFSYLRTMPVFLENLHSYHMYEFNTGENYHFQLSLKNDAAALRKNMTPNQLKEIEANGYTLFDGEIISNKVPIKNVDMPE